MMIIYGKEDTISVDLPRSLVEKIAFQMEEPDNDMDWYAIYSASLKAMLVKNGN